MARRNAGDAPLESSIQQSIVQWMDANCPWLVWHATPGRVMTSVKARALANRRGMRSGWPDLIVFRPHQASAADAEWRTARVMAMEVKRPAPNKTYPTETQLVCHDELRRCGVPVFVVRSLDEAVAALVKAGFHEPDAYAGKSA